MRLNEARHLGVGSMVGRLWPERVELAPLDARVTVGQHGECRAVGEQPAQERRGRWVRGDVGRVRTVGGDEVADRHAVSEAPRGEPPVEGVAAYPALEQRHEL